jgi:hypothetical protein
MEEEEIKAANCAIESGLATPSNVGSGTKDDGHSSF